MPNGDRTGPRGMGPQSGRAAGYCAGFDMPGSENPVAGPGLGRGRGQGRGLRGRGGRGGGQGGRGRRNRFYATGLTGCQTGVAGEPLAAIPAGQDAGQLETLKAQVAQLQDALDTLHDQVEQLQPQADKD